MDIKKKSRKQEERVAKEIGGRPTPASGALWGAKGDVRNPDFLVECKYTDATYYALVKRVWKKICEEALASNFRTPLMCIDIADESFAVIRMADFHSLRATQTPIEPLYFTDITNKLSFRIKAGLDDIHLFRCMDWEFKNEVTEILVMPWEMFKFHMKDNL